jgi:hypothetical protein
MAYYSSSLILDPYLALAHLQRAVILMTEFEDYEGAFVELTRVIELLLDNNSIYYRQIGLQYKIYLCEVLYNRAICSNLLSDPEVMIMDIREARLCTERDDQKHIIERASRTGVIENVVFGLPASCIFCVPDTKIRNLEMKKYLGESTMIVMGGCGNESGGREDDDNKGFSGNTLLRQKEKETQENGFECTRFMGDPENSRERVGEVAKGKKVHHSLVLKCKPTRPILPRKESLSASTLVSSPRSRVKRKNALIDPVHPRRKASLCKTMFSTRSDDTALSEFYTPDCNLMKKYKISYEGMRIIVRVPTDSLNVLIQTVRRKLGCDDVYLFYRDEGREFIRIRDKEDLLHDGSELLAVTSWEGEGDIDELV